MSCVFPGLPPLHGQRRQSWIRYLETRGMGADQKLEPSNSAPQLLKQPSEGSTQESQRARHPSSAKHLRGSRGLAPTVARTAKRPMIAEKGGVYMQRYLLPRLDGSLAIPGQDRQVQPPLAWTTSIRECLKGEKPEQRSVPELTMESEQAPSEVNRSKEEGPPPPPVKKKRPPRKRIEPEQSQSKANPWRGKNENSKASGGGGCDSEASSSTTWSVATQKKQEPDSQKKLQDTLRKTSKESGASTASVSSSGEGSDDSDCGSSNDSAFNDGRLGSSFGREAVDVELPPWYPSELTCELPRSADNSTQEPAAPEVKCVGPGKLLVRWRLPERPQLALTWFVRVRHKGETDSGDWQLVDLDAGRIQSGFLDDRLSWKHRALVVQPGLRVLGFCAHEGEKSKSAHLGTLVAYYPGLAVVDFDPKEGDEDKSSKRQRVPQDWILLAASQKTLREVMSEATAKRSKAGNLWKVVKNKVYDGLVRAHSHCCIIWNYYVPDVTPEMNMRLGASCAMSVSNGEPAAPTGFLGCESLALTMKSSDGCESLALGSVARQTEQELETVHTWWPVVLDRRARGMQRRSICEEGNDKLTEQPKELCCSSDLHILLEPNPRIQVIPRQWVCEKLPEAMRAARNICVGQSILSYYNRAMSEESDAEMPEPRGADDMTLVESDRRIEPKRSERAVRCSVLREFVSPALVFLRVHCRANGKTMRLPLTSVVKIYVMLDTKRSESRIPLEWVVIRSSSDGAFSVFARTEKNQDLDNATKIEVGMNLFQKVTGHANAKRTEVQEVLAQITHYEVGFEQQTLKIKEKVSAHSLTTRIDEMGVHRRMHEPQITIHDIPDAMDNMEVSVGVTRSLDGGIPVWSAPSRPCEVSFQGAPTCSPLGPSIVADGLTRVEMRWLLPADPLASCFRVRVREKGAQDWSYVDSSGRFREDEHTFAWQARLVPLVNDLWASAFGNYDGHKTSTHGPARIVEVCGNDQGIKNNTVKVRFQKHSAELNLMPEDTAALTAEDSAALTTYFGEIQTIPVDWIEAVWFRDGPNFLKASVMTSWKLCEHVTLIPVGQAASEVSFAGGCNYEVQLNGENETLPNVVATPGYLSAAGIYVQPNSRENIVAKMQLASVQIHSLKNEIDYEFGVQALTKGGWTDWSENSFQMPRTALVTRELVHEKSHASVFYKSALLSQAFFKEYEKCWVTLEKALPEDRLEKVKVALKECTPKNNLVDQKLSRWLVDMDGPIRSKAPMSDTRMKLQELVRRRADLNYRDQSTGRTPLTYACEYGQTYVHHGVVPELLKLRADVDSMNDHRQTALALAAQGGSTRVVRTLLDAGADTNVITISGHTAHSFAAATHIMGKSEKDDRIAVRCDLCRDRVPWNVFVEKIEAADSPVAAAKVFLDLAFPGDPAGSSVFVEDVDGSKRISKHDRLRLREQILEAREQSDDEADQRGLFCGKELLKQMSMAALQTIENKECAIFTRYLLTSAVMRYVHKEAHQGATDILKHFEVALTDMRNQLVILPTLTEKAEYAKTMSIPYLNRNLHQWHAHGDLPWLTERNVVGAFEALVHSKSLEDLGDFCDWIGELSARIHACYRDSETLGAWDDRLPSFFWGDAYVKFLLGEAGRTKPVFDTIVDKLVARVEAALVGSKLNYRRAPNKNYTRVSKKQVEYATLGLLACHVAMDHLQGCFRQVIRADLENDSGYKVEIKRKDVHRTGAILILGSLESLDNVTVAIDTVTRQPSTPAAIVAGDSENCQTVADSSLTSRVSGPPILVLFRAPREEAQKEILEKEKVRLEECGVDLVIVLDGPLELPNVLKTLSVGVAEAYAKREIQMPSPVHNSSDKLQILFEMQKCTTKFKQDLLCAGGLLDLVRGSLVCSSEEEIRKIYELASEMTLQDDSAEVVRVKNGFHTPVTGGYCDLKLFVQVAHDHGGVRVCHICELQVHLNIFLDKKKFTHMPYVIDRGDFDDS